MKTAKPKPRGSLAKRLGSARHLLREYRRALIDGHKERGDGPNCGKVLDPAELDEIERTERAIAAIGEAINAHLEAARERRAA